MGVIIIINFKVLFINILIPIAFGFTGGFLGNSSEGFKNIPKPQFAPPGIVFPIVWSVLYILMGISSYLIYTSSNKNKKSALIIYGIQLLLNSLWTLFFFRLKWYLFSFIWILFIMLFVVIMICKFYKINKVSAFIQIPYLLWLIFASILNFSIYLLS